MHLSVEDQSKRWKVEHQMNREKYMKLFNGLLLFYKNGRDENAGELLLRTFYITSEIVRCY